MKIIAALCPLLFVGPTVLAAADVSRSEMVVIAAGIFTMGSSDGPEDERPAHEVHVAAFEIDRLPVTNAQFAEFLDANGTHNRNGERLYDYDDPDARIHRQGGRWTADMGYENHPAVEASWPGASRLQ